MEINLKASIAAFRKAGGKITKCAGFTRIIPMPEYKPPKRKKAKVKYEPILRVVPNENQVGREFIAKAVGFASCTSLRRKPYCDLMPKRLKVMDKAGGTLYDKQEALQAIESILDHREKSGMLRPSADADQRVAGVIKEFARKQRNKRELRKTWTT